MGQRVEVVNSNIVMPGVRLSVKAIIVRSGRLLVLKCRDQQGHWYVLPGGGQQVGETVDQALRRECREELGCEVRMGPLRFIRDYISKHHEFAAIDPDTHQVELIFEGHLESEPSMATQPDSMQEGFAWLDITSLPGCRLYPRVLEQALCSAEKAGVIYLGDVN
jgi:ADP-ribose pyrophosphatase YjhB (NUDIX family)